MKLEQHSETIILKALQEKKNNKSIVFVSGQFNILHPGHLRLLRFASECGDYLIIGILPDNKEQAIISEELRLEGVKAISWVNYSFILKDKIEDFISKLQPDIIVKGKEHELRINPEEKIVNLYGGRLLFGSGDTSFSSIDLLRKEFLENDFLTIQKPTEFLTRHKVTLNDLAATVHRFQNLNICVIGDTIVDEYITCEALGMSQEDPTIVVTPILNQKFIGGAGIVAAHAAGLKAKVSFFSVVGSDDTAKFVKEQLAEKNVNAYLHVDESRPTTLKMKYRASGKTLLRVSQLRQHAISRAVQKEILNDISPILKNADLLVFSDFNYGCLPQELVDRIEEYCGELDVMIVADSQCSSQIGDISRFKNTTLLTPTEHEARLGVRDFSSGLVVLAEFLRKKSKGKHILVALGKEGVLIHANDKANDVRLTDRLPAFNVSPKDVSGAGDSLLICTAMSCALGNNIWHSTYLGSLAAACQVGRLGNIPLEPQHLLDEIKL
jgi:rfaE bifunctional protein kinase chain/domain